MMLHRAGYFGVGKEDIEIKIIIGNTSPEVHFKDGFIISDLSVEILNSLTNYLYTNSAFLNPRYFLVVKKDFNDKFVQEIHDIFSNALETRASSDASKIIQSKNEYNILGNILSQIAPTNGNTQLIGNTEFTYNTAGQILSKFTPDGGLVQYTYYDDGSIRFETTYNTTNNNVVRELRYVYDDLSRPVLLKEFKPTISYENNEREITTWIYDNIESATSSGIFKNIPVNYFSSVSNTRNRLAAVIYTNYGAKKTSVGEIFSYDDEGRVSFKLMVIEGITGYQESRYEYDVHGKVTAEYCFYNGEILKKRYTYDKLGRLSDVYHCTTANGGGTYTDNLVVHNTYDDLGVLTTKNLATIPAGYNVGYEYDIRDQLTSITKPSGKNGFEESIVLYDKTGNIKNANYNYFTNSTSTPTSAFEMSYTYDDIYRLKTAEPTDIGQKSVYGATYDYNQVGQFNSKQEGASNLTGYEYYPMNNRLKKTSKNGTSEDYIYDDHGNLIIDFIKKMVVEYDWRNLPVTYRFYNNIPSGISKDSDGTCTRSDVYGYVNSKVVDGTVQLLSTVVMVYNAAGQRVGKLDFN